MTRVSRCSNLIVVLLLVRVLSAKHAHSGLRGSMENTQRRERPTSSRRLNLTEGETTTSGSPPIQFYGGLQLR
jgi:hypothetical protein